LGEACAGSLAVIRGIRVGTTLRESAEAAPGVLMKWVMLERNSEFDSVWPGA
jgi:hypothetical protein